MVGLCAGFLSAPVAGGFFLEDLGPEFFPSFGAVYRVTAHDLEHRSNDADAHAEKGTRRGCPRLSWVTRKVCVPHYLRQVADGSLSSFVRWTTIRNVRLNADQPRAWSSTLVPECSQSRGQIPARANAPLFRSCWCQLWNDTRRVA